MILDPRIDRCIVWFTNKPKVQVINGSPKECIDRVIEYVTRYEFNETKNENLLVQWCDIKLDVSGCAGKVYAERFKKYGIKFDVIKYVDDIV